MFLSFHDNKNENVVSPNLFTKWKKIKNKNLGDIKCVEVKRVFCIKDEKKKHFDKNWKVVIVSAQLLNLYQKGGGGVGWHARH